MTKPNNLNSQSDFINISDYSLKQPVGTKHFFAFISLIDGSEYHWGTIYTPDRATAMLQVIGKFFDRLNEVRTFNLYEQEK